MYSLEGEALTNTNRDRRNTMKRRAILTIVTIFLYPALLIGVLSAFFWVSLKAGFKAGLEVMDAFVTENTKP